MGNDKKVKSKQYVIAFPIGGFLVGLLFVLAAFVLLHLKAGLVERRTLWDSIRGVHIKYPLLLLIDALPVVLALVGLWVGIFQKKRCASLMGRLGSLERQNRQLESFQFLYSVMFEKTDDCLIVTTAQGDIIDINPAGARLLRVEVLTDKKPESREALIEILKMMKVNARSVYVNEEDRQRIVETLREKGSVSNVHAKLKRFDGKVFDAMVSGFLGKGSNGEELIFGRIIDLSDVKQTEILLRKVNEQLEKKNKELIKAFSELQAMKVRFENRSKDLERLNQQLDYANKLLSKLAITDGLTGLYNHKHFVGLLEKEWERAKRSKSSFCVIMIDVDYFKSFNDKWGHQIGDKALKSLARTIRGQTRSYDIVARYGGEEFSLILPETDLNTCYTVAQRIRKAVEKKTLLIKSQNVKVHLTVSVGVTIFLPEQDDPRSFEQVLQDADVALYLAKNRGRNRVEMYRRDVIAESAKIVPTPEINEEE